jgi:glycosyltransferase involved in cell wall biosynthesis
VDGGSDPAAAPRGRPVALFLPALEGGGAERAYLRLGGALAAEGHATDLVVATDRGVLWDDVPPGVRLVRLGSGRSATAVTALVRYLRRERPRALVSAITHANVIAILAAGMARTRTPVVVNEQLHLSSEVARSRVLVALIRALYPRAAAAVAVSQGVARDLEGVAGMRPGSVRVIFNPLPVEELRRRAAGPSGHPWIDGEGGPPVILAAGRLEPQKDFSTLLRAFATVRAHAPARLVVIGEGGLRGDLEREVAELGLAADVSLPGFAANPYPFFAGARMYALSSRFEGLPTVLLECLALRLPVVATDCPSGPREILAGGRLGRLVPVGDPAALATAMLAELRSPTTVPADAVDPYRAERVAAEYARLLDGVAGHT